MRLLLLVLYVNAEAYCDEFFGTTLATIPSVKYNDEVHNLVSSQGRSWIGYDDLDIEGTFEWAGINSDYNPQHFEKWCSGEPNNYASNEHCAEMKTSSSKCWNDIRCHYRRKFVCNRKFISKLFKNL